MSTLSSEKRVIPFYALVSGTAFFLLGTVLLHLVFEEDRVSPNAGEVRKAILRQIPEDHLRIHIDSAKEAKRHHTFWANYTGRLETKGFALESDSVISEVFQGYAPFTRNFWKAYFEAEFNQQWWIASLSEDRPASQGLFVFTPWWSCFDVWRQQGADVLVLGSSQTYRGLVGNILGKASNRVLNCGRSKMQLLTLEATTKLLFELEPPKQARWAVLGLSYWNLQTPGDWVAQQSRNQLRQLAKFKKPSLATFSFRLSDHFRPLSWGDFFKPSLEKALKSEPAQRAIKQWRQGIHIGVPKENSISEEALENWASSLVEKNDTHLESDCFHPTVRKQIDQLVKNTKKIAERILVYLPPTTRVNELTFSEGFRTCVQNRLAKLSDNRVTVLSKEGTYFELGYREFLYLGDEQVPYYIDMTHPNFGGAVKISRKLAQLLNDGQPSPRLSYRGP